MLRITSLQKYSIHDGDGIRTTVFFKGCPLKCAWCHNPETQGFGKELLDHPEKCTGCGACVKVCPKGAVSLLNKAGADDGAESAAGAGTADGSAHEDGKTGTAETDRNLCAACGKCTLFCPEGLREIAGREMAVKELLKELLKDRIFYEDSGGGVTFSGGEVLAGNMKEVISLAAALKKEGISLYIDTCGEAPWENFEAILPYADAFLYDLKFVDFEKHRQYTGVGNFRILGNLKRLSDCGAVIDLRIPLVRGVNGTKEEIGAMTAYLLEQKICPRRVHLLPYHNTGMAKYSRMGRKYDGEDFSPPTEEELTEYEEMFRAAGFRDVRRGG